MLCLNIHATAYSDWHCFLVYLFVCFCVCLFMCVFILLWASFWQEHNKVSHITNFVHIFTFLLYILKVFTRICWLAQFQVKNLLNVCKKASLPSLLAFKSHISAVPIDVHTKVIHSIMQDTSQTKTGPSICHSFSLCALLKKKSLQNGTNTYISLSVSQYFVYTHIRFWNCLHLVFTLYNNNNNNNNNIIDLYSA